MIMTFTACKDRGNLDHLISVHLIVGFIGQLKEWWDNAPTEEELELLQKKLSDVF